jgi:drug/metabolite transporter (DMT)-like permease
VKPLVGISLKILSALAFTAMSAGIKHVSAAYPTGEIVFFRSAFAIAPLLAWLLWRGDLVDAVRTSNIGGHLLRGIVSSCGMFAGFVALAYLPLSDAVAIGYASPLIVVALAALILKERVRAYRWTAVAVGFIGVLFMLMPQLDAGPPGWRPVERPGHRRGLCAYRSILLGGRHDPGPAAPQDRTDRRHRALLLADDDRPRPPHYRARLAYAWAG